MRNINKNNLSRGTSPLSDVKFVGQAFHTQEQRRSKIKNNFETENKKWNYPSPFRYNR